MIRYTLACGEGHTFESWFPSSHAYDEQAERGLVSCPLCGSAKVAKTLMAPALGRGEAGPTAPRPDAPEPPPAALSGEPEQRLRAMVRAFHAHLRSSADDVGSRFAEEARSMHQGDIPHRAIYGKASLGEARDLVSEGVEICPIPPLPDDQN